MRTKSALTLAAMLVLTACGSDTGDSERDPTDASPETVAAQTKTVAPAPVERTTEPSELPDGGPNPAFGPGVDNLQACEDFLAPPPDHETSVLERFAPTLADFAEEAPGATQAATSLDTELQLILQQAEGPLREAFIELRAPYKQIQEAVQAGETTVTFDVPDLLDVTTRILEECIAVGYNQ